MASLNELSRVAGVQLQRAAMLAVLRSRTFAKNPRLAALLEYLCERCFDGEAASIKEFNIATDVFGRPAEFDQSQDAIVRVEMHRLRKKIAEFYAIEGQQEPIEIVIHSGHYVPEFVPRSGAVSSLLAQQPPETAVIGTAISDQNRPERRRSPQRYWLIAGVITAMVMVSAAALVFVWGRNRTGARASDAARVHTSVPMKPSAAPAVPITGGVRILCGSSKSGWRDLAGNVWGADSFFSGGLAVEVPEHPIYRARDSFVFRTMRTGEFSYRIPLKPGVYEMHLYFADQAYSPGVTLDGGESMRVFSVTLNGDVLLRDFDIIADAGPNTADVRVFKDVHPESDGYLHLSFFRTLGTPLINGIAIIPGIAGCMRPVRIVTQDTTFIDRAGVTWSADNYFLNGRALERSATVSRPKDPRI